MKYILILFLLLSGFINESSGQSTQKEAKRLYFSALANYHINKLGSCISDLKKVKTLLKGTNLKVQPLIIKALFESRDYENVIKEISKYKALKPNTEWAEYHKIMQIHKRSNKYIKEIRSEYKKLLLTNKISPHYKFRKNNPKSSFVEKFNKRINSLEYLPQNASFVNQKAYKQYNKRNYKKAIKLYEKVLKNSPENHEANFWAGNSYYDSKKFNSAYPFYKKSVEIKPKDYHSNYWYGKINYDIKSYQLAITYLKKALLHKQNDYKSNYWLGHSYYNLNDLDSAAMYFEPAVKLKPYDYYANYWLGIAYDFNNKSKNAIPFFEKSVQLKPNDFWAHYNLGKAYLNIYNFSKATEHLKKAINIKPDNYYPNYSLGYVYFLKREYSLATKHFTNALKNNADDTGATYYLAKSYYKSGDIAVAKVYFNKTIELEKTNESSLTAYAYIYLELKEKAFYIMQSLEKKAINNDLKKSLYYNYACLYSILNKRKDAIEYLTKAFTLGYIDFNHIRLDADLNNIRNNRLKKLIDKYKSKT